MPAIVGTIENRRANNHPLPIRYFVGSVGTLLLITALAKIVSATGSARILHNSDPILGISFQRVFEIVGSLELIIAMICFFGKNLGIKAGVVAWLATSFLVYRFGLIWVGYTKPCSCMGNLTDALHISPQIADTTLKILLVYLFLLDNG